MVKCVNQLHEGISLYIACMVTNTLLKLVGFLAAKFEGLISVTWHSSGLSTNLSWSIMLVSERSQAPSVKSQQAPFEPGSGGLQAVEVNKIDIINHFSIEREEEREKE